MGPPIRSQSVSFKTFFEKLGTHDFDYDDGIVVEVVRAESLIMSLERTKYRELTNGSKLLA